MLQVPGWGSIGPFPQGHPVGRLMAPAGPAVSQERLRAAGLYCG